MTLMAEIAGAIVVGYALAAALVVGVIKAIDRHGR